MPRSSSAKPGKTQKSKGAHSTLTPSQLARKRANDREAQRVIRARTKEHIERLEAEVEELKSHRSTDKRMQELLQRNQVLESENMQLRSKMGGSEAPQQPFLSVTRSPYSTPNIYNDSLTTASGMHSPCTPPLSNTDYSSLPNAVFDTGAYPPISSHQGHQVGGPLSAIINAGYTTDMVYTATAHVTTSTSMQQ